MQSHIDHKTTVVLNSQALNANKVFVNAGHKNYAITMQNNIRKFRADREWSQTTLAELVGTSQTQIDRLEKNQRRVSTYWLEKLAKVFKCSPIDLISDSDNVGAQVEIRYHIKGGKMLLLDKQLVGGKFALARSPTGYNPTIMECAQALDDGLQPYLETNWLAFFEKAKEGEISNALSPCAIQSVNYGLLIRKIRPGSTPGLYHLLFHNVEPLFDQPVIWASRIIETRPE